MKVWELANYLQTFPDQDADVYVLQHTQDKWGHDEVREVVLDDILTQTDYTDEVREVVLDDILTQTDYTDLRNNPFVSPAHPLKGQHRLLLGELL